MCQIWFYGVLFVFIFRINQAHVIPQSNSWIPLTKEEVLGRHTRTSMSNEDDILEYFLPKYKEMADANFVTGNDMKVIASFPMMNSDVNLFKRKAIQLITPAVSNRFGPENVYYPVEPETVQSVNDLQSKECNKGDGFNSQHVGSIDSSSNLLSLKNKLNTKDHQEDVKDIKERKAKAIIDDIHHDNMFVPEIESDFDDSGKLESLNVFRREENRKHYKVTEETTDTQEDETDQFRIGVKGYSYTPPQFDLNFPAKNKITDNFFDILSKHNIKPEDDLPNYTLSREAKARNLTNFFMFVPVPLRLHPQFNNLNQLSVDPSLAVLMSNYGYYFPGSYGIHSRYRNLYGYLASNNIHNNKPFGSYKIFSDTDASN